MSRQPQSNPPLFTQVDISAGSQESVSSNQSDDTGRVLRDILVAQDRQNELLEELVNVLGASQRQRAAELKQWKQANPHLARDCRTAAETLSRVQTMFLSRLAEEVTENPDALLDGEFMLNEFVDRFGPRLAHLNGVLQVLSQLSGSDQG